jgi:DNA-binding transcriptional ArsR family regulator
MTARPALPRLAQTIGEPTRLRMLGLLMEGRALVAKELAFGAGVEPATATSHLRRLEEDGLLRSARQGRNKVFRLASPAVARVVETLMSLAAPPELPAAVLDPLRAARFCYDHLAGRLGIALTDALVAKRLLVARRDTFDVGPAGEAWLRGLAIDPAAVHATRRKLAPRCLDWSERRDHVAGAFGAAFAGRFVELGWIRRRPDSRIVDVTAAGRRGIKDALGVVLPSRA